MSEGLFSGFSIFKLLGADGTPVTVNNEGRLDVVQHAHSSNVSLHMDVSLSASQDFIIIDKSDTTNYKHVGTNYLHLENIFVEVDADVNADYIITIGFLENVDATGGDFHEIAHISGTKKTGQSKSYARPSYPNGQELRSDSTVTSDISIGDTAFQTDVNLASTLNPAAIDTPSGDGDFVMRVIMNAGNIDVEMGLSYHGH